VNFGVRKGALVWRYLRDPTFSRFDTIPECDRHTHTDRHTTTAYTVLSIASRGKNGWYFTYFPRNPSMYGFLPNFAQL